MKKKLFYILIILLLPVFSLSAFDWGLLLNQGTGVLGGNGYDSDFRYSGTLSPWLFFPKSWGNLYVSLGPEISYENKSAALVVDIYRTELALRIGKAAGIELGRMPYTDPMGFVASGLFDGLRYSQNIAGGTLALGVWYTGLLYKKSAQITMTEDDYFSYITKLDYKNFADTYFSSRRLLFALDWDNADILDWLQLRLAFLGQVDLNGNGNYYHSQYFAIKTNIHVSNFIFDLGFCPQLAQTPNGIKAGAAWEAAMGLVPPTPTRDLLKLTGRFSNGTTADDSEIAAFVPVTTVEQGDVLKAKLSGLSMLRLDYIIRPLNSLSFNLASSYFILSDKASYTGLPAGKQGHFLGNEFSGKVVFIPLSDLRFNLGLGVFLPSWGNADPDAKALWRVELNMTLAIF